MYYIVLPDSTTTELVVVVVKKNEKKILWPCSLTNLTVKKNLIQGELIMYPKTLLVIKQMLA